MQFKKTKLPFFKEMTSIIELFYNNNQNFYNVIFPLHVGHKKVTWKNYRKCHCHFISDDQGQKTIASNSPCDRI